MRKLTHLFIALILGGFVVLQSCSDDEPAMEPGLTASESEFDFGTVTAGEVSEARSYTLTGTDLSSDVNVSTSAPFGISLDESGSFTTSLSIDAAELTAGAVTVFVVFQPVAGNIGAASADITHTTSGLETGPVVSLSGTTSAALNPSITISETELDFGNVVVDSDVDPLSYTIGAEDITNPVSVSTEAPFSLSLSADGTYEESLTLDAADFEGSAITIYVKPSPSSTGELQGTVTHNSDDVADLASITLSAVSIPDLLFLENFDYTLGEELPHTDRTDDGAANAELDGWVDVRPDRTPFIITEGLTFEGYPGSGIGNGALVEFDASEGPTNRQLFAHNLSEQQDDEFTGSYYVAYMLEVNGVPLRGQYNRPVMLVDWLPTGVTDFATHAIIANTATQDDTEDHVVFGIQDNAPAARQLTELEVQVGETYVVVFKHTVTDTDFSNNNNTLELFIIEGDAEIPATEPTANAVLEGVNDSRRIKAVGILKDNSGSGSFVVDGLKVANTWEDLFR